MRGESPTHSNQDQSEKAFHGFREASVQRELIWVFTVRHAPSAHSHHYFTFPCFVKHNSNCNFVETWPNTTFPTHLTAINLNIGILAAAFITSIKES